MKKASDLHERRTLVVQGCFSLRICCMSQIQSPLFAQTTPNKTETMYFTMFYVTMEL